MHTTIDLFCGAGGLTQGFKQAGFECLYGNDIDPDAIATFGENHPLAVADPGSVEEVNPLRVRKDLGVRRGEVTALVGGPPCQGFSINAPGRFLHDERNRLFTHYIRFLEEFEPEYFVFENVPGLLSLGEGDVFHEILDEFAERGYETAAKILFAAHYGVPQERWRLIILGSRRGAVTHPVPTHYATARANFRGGSTMTFRLTPLDSELLLPATTVGEAIQDLPRLRIGEGSEIVEYTSEAISTFAKALRNPEGKTYNHFAGELSRQNIVRLQHIKPGGSWRDIPHDLLPAGMQRARKSDHTRRYGRLRFDGLAGTIMTKCDPHWGPVFLPDQDRALTVREAARLQSFPDSYRFTGSRVAQYRQVGNAVPPLMAAAIAQSIMTNHLRVVEKVSAWR